MFSGSVNTVRHIQGNDNVCVVYMCACVHMVEEELGRQDLWHIRNEVSNLVFYAQSTIAVISGQRMK